MHAYDHRPRPSTTVPSLILQNDFAVCPLAPSLHCTNRQSHVHSSEPSILNVDPTLFHCREMDPMAFKALCAVLLCH